MLSALSNNAAVSALNMLRSTISSGDDARMRVITGYRVADASDDAAYWSIATTIRSDNKTLSAVEDALGMAAAVVDTARDGMQAAVDVLAEIKSRLILAREPGSDKDKINTDVEMLKAQLRSIAESSSFSGQNWLTRREAGDENDRSLVAGFTRQADGQIKVLGLDYEIGGTAGTTDINFLVDDVDGQRGILTSAAFANALGTSKNWVLFNGAGGPANDEMILSASTTDEEVSEMISVVDSMRERVTMTATRIGAISKAIDLQHAFSADLQDSLSFGVGRMVDADMDKESGRLKALQVQERLSQEGLAIANASSSVILQLLN